MLPILVRGVTRCRHLGEVAVSVPSQKFVGADLGGKVRKRGRGRDNLSRSGPGYTVLSDSLFRGTSELDQGGRIFTSAQSMTKGRTRKTPVIASPSIPSSSIL